MMGRAKKNSTATDNYLDYTMKVMKENEEFLHRNAEETYREVIDLINNAIDFVGSAVARDKSREGYVERSMIFFLYHILMPSSYAIHADLLIGNLAACFMELRLMLESLAKCYLADLKYPEQSFFKEKLELIEDDLKKGNVSTSKLMKKLGEKLGFKNDFIALWGKLSKDWIHPKGVIDKVVAQIGEKSWPPSWTLGIPMNYAEDDLDTINELYKRVSQFRKLLKVTIDNYKQKSSFGEV
jgi:hypothetical protein